MPNYRIHVTRWEPHAVEIEVKAGTKTNAKRIASQCLEQWHMPTNHHITKLEVKPKKITRPKLSLIHPEEIEEINYA